MQTLEAFKKYYKDFSDYPLDELDQFYAQHVIFIDPIHRIQGLQQMKAYFSTMTSNLKSCHFEFIEETVADKHVWLKWRMKLRHSKLKNGHKITLVGVSHLQLDDSGKVCAHEDFYDMGAMLYEHIPLLGWGARTLKKQLATAA